MERFIIKKIVKKHKVISTALICVVVILASMVALSHGVYHRSFVATVIEIYMNVIDREAMYAAYADAVPNQLVVKARASEETPEEIEKELREAEPYLKPNSVKMDVS